jgi:hypothetical protein
VLIAHDDVNDVFVHIPISLVGTITNADNFRKSGCVINLLPIWLWRVLHLFCYLEENLTRRRHGANVMITIFSDFRQFAKINWCFS